MKRIQVKDASRYTVGSLEGFILFKSCEETRQIEFQINWKVMDLNGLIEIRDLCRTFERSTIVVSVFGIRKFWFFAENSNFDYLLASDSYLIFNWDGQSPFIKKLIRQFNLVELKIGKGVQLYESVFKCLLQNGRRIRRLTIESYRLTQQQLDRMPGYLSGLRYLTFDQSSRLNDINFDFVVKFNLSNLTFGFNIQKETMSLILNRFKCEPKFCLKVNNRPDEQYIFIPTQINENGRFEIICSSSYNCVKHEFVSLEDAIDFYFKNDLFNRKIEE